MLTDSDLSRIDRDKKAWAIALTVYDEDDEEQTERLMAMGRVAAVSLPWALDTILAMEEENKKMGDVLRDASALLVSFAKDPDLKIDRRTRAGEIAKDGIAALAQRGGEAT